jgi:hypothetical protein
MVPTSKPAIPISELTLSRLGVAYYYIRFANSMGFRGFDKWDNKNEAGKP